MRDVTATWFYGPTRTGKSWAAIKALGCDPLAGMAPIYFKNSQNKWFCGYSGQLKVLVDELPKETSRWCLNYLKMWTDKLPLLVETKGSTVPALWTEVAVTC